MIQQAVSAILQDECVVFPTETVYGLGANALSVKAVSKIFHHKNRPPKNPLIVHIAHINQIEQIAHSMNSLEQQLFETFAPGPFSLILPKKSCVPDNVTGGFDTVGVRIPDHPLALDFLKAVNLPICAPSANISGKPSPTTFEMATHYMQGKAKVILNGGDLRIGIESTVVKVVDNQIYLLRAGAVTPDMIADTVGIQPITNPSESRQESPGTHYAHYQPLAMIHLFTTLPENIPVNSMLLALDSNWTHPNFTHKIYFEDLAEYAQQLYALFFEADKHHLSHIFCEIPSEYNEGLALRDRLFRAAEQT